MSRSTTIRSTFETDVLLSRTKVTIRIEENRKTKFTDLRVHSHLWFIRSDLLPEHFSPCNRKKWVHSPSFNFSVHAKIDQIVSTNVLP